MHRRRLLSIIGFLALGAPLFVSAAQIGSATEGWYVPTAVVYFGSLTGLGFFFSEAWGTS